MVVFLGKGSALWRGVVGLCPGCPGGRGGGRGGQVLPRILVTCPGSQGTSCPCSPFMIRVEVPGSSFMLCLGPGPSSLLYLTRADLIWPYAGDTPTIFFYWGEKGGGFQCTWPRGGWHEDPTRDWELNMATRILHVTRRW
jgi:hypothetical protein